MSTLPWWKIADTADHIIKLERETASTFDSITYHIADDDVTFRSVEKEDGSVGAAGGFSLEDLREALYSISLLKSKKA